MRAIILVGLLFFMAAPVLAADSDTKSGKQVSAKEIYELSEKCAKTADEWFKMHKYGNPHISEVYSCLYNRYMNKCLMLITATGPDSEVKYVYDLNENRRLGGCLRFTQTNHVHKCESLGTICQSQSEWDSLVKPYMEE